jgi:Flp pilus assembly CpaF family ATPase
MGRLFEGEESVLRVIERIVARLGLRVDESSPWWMLDYRTTAGCTPQFLEPISRLPYQADALNTR